MKLKMKKVTPKAIFCQTWDVPARFQTCYWQRFRRRIMGGGVVQNLMTYFWGWKFTYRSCEKRGTLFCLSVGHSPWLQPVFKHKGFPTVPAPSPAPLLRLPVSTSSTLLPVIFFTWKMTANPSSKGCRWPPAQHRGSAGVGREGHGTAAASVLSAGTERQSSLQALCRGRRRGQFSWSCCRAGSRKPRNSHHPPAAHPSAQTRRNTTADGRERFFTFFFHQLTSNIKWSD